LATRSAIWKSIADTLAAEIAEGHYAPGDRLPTEAQLSARFGVNRHTVRHALQALADLGTVHARRGSGVYVTARPTDYPLSRRTRFHENVLASGRTPSRRLNRLETRACDGEEAAAMRLNPGDPVHVVEGISLVDDQPIAVFRSLEDGADMSFQGKNMPTASFVIELTFTAPDIDEAAKAAEEKKATHHSKS